MGKRGATAMRHARACVADRYPGAPLLEAYQTVVWIRQAGERKPIPISRQEDLFGVFDLLVLPATGVVTLIQVTTWTRGGGVAARRNKIEAWINRHFEEVANQVATIYVMAWIRRQHFRVWTWSWTRREWEEAPVVESPLLRAKRLPRQGLGGELAGRRSGSRSTEIPADRSLPSEPAEP